MLGQQWHYIGTLQYIPFIYTVNFNVRPTVTLYRNLTVHTIYIYTVNFNVRPTVALYRNLTVHTIYIYS